MFKTLRRQFEKERLGDACHLDDKDGMEVEGTVRPWRRGYEASASARCAPVGMQAHHHQLFTLSFDSISNLRYAYPAPRVIKNWCLRSDLQATRDASIPVIREIRL